jgi:xylan 1,4-beta-xylosidase
VEASGFDRLHPSLQYHIVNTLGWRQLRPLQDRAVGPVLDGSILSDDYVEDAEIRYRPCFTGAFVGLCCQDLSGQGLHADFDGFAYLEFEIPEMGNR